MLSIAAVETRCLRKRNMVSCRLGTWERLLYRGRGDKRRCAAGRGPHILAGLLLFFFSEVLTASSSLEAIESARPSSGGESVPRAMMVIRLLARRIARRPGMVVVWTESLRGIEVGLARFSQGFKDGSSASVAPSEPQPQCYF